MIIDQLFEDDDKKKKLNEIDPRNYDSDEDYYNDLHGEDDDEDFDGDAADDEVADMDNDEESHYEKYVRVNNLESKINEFEMPVGQATGTAAQDNDKPRQTYSVKVVGTFVKPRVFTAEDLWLTLETILPRDYPRVPFQRQSGNEPQRRVLDDINSDGFSIVKQGINNLDIAETIASKFERKGIPAEVIDGGLYEEGLARKTDAKGRTQQQWIQAVYKKFPDARIVQAKMIDGPCHAMLPDGRKFSWTPVQGIAESTSKELRLAVYQAILDIHFGAKYGDEMIDTVTDELGDYFDDVQASGDPVLQKVYAYVRQEGAEAEGDPARMDRVALNAIEFLNYEGARGSLTESRRNKQRKLNEAMLMEDPIYRKFKQVGRYIAERKMTEKEILDVFAAAEAGMTNAGTGANRTMLGRGKDTATKFAGNVSGAVKGVLDSMRNSVPVQAVEVAYDQATDALADVAGGQDGPVMNVLKQYRMLAKEYPKTTGLVRSALIMAAGMATGGAAPIAIIGALGALDRALKGNTLFNSLTGGAADSALAGVSRAVAGAMGSDVAQIPGDNAHDMDMMSNMGDVDPSGQVPAADSLAPGEEIAPSPSRFDSIVDNAVDYKVKPDDALTKILADRRINPEAFKRLPGNEVFFGPDGNPNLLKAGQIIKLPDPADVADLNKMSWTTPSDPSLAKDFGNPDFYTGQYNQNSTSGLDAANNLKQQELGRWGSDNGMSAARAAKDAGGGMDMGSGSGLPSHASAAGDYGMGGNAPIDYSQPGPISTDSLGQKLEYGMPVSDNGSFIPPNPNLPAEELATQQAAYDAWKADFMRRYPDATQAADGSMQGIKPGLAPMYPTNYTPGMNTNGLTPKAVQESVKIKKLSFDKLVDQKSTVMNWALSESVGRKSKSVNLTTVGTYTVFENVDRYRKALLEYAETQPGRPELPDLYRPDMADAPMQPADPAKKSWLGKGIDYLDKGVKKVGGALSNFGHQFTTNVTKEKLKMNWHQAGKPSDSDALAAWLVKQGVPQDVVTNVYGSMGIPYTAPAAEPAAATTEPAAATTEPAAATGGAQKQMAFYGTNPKTQKPWTYDELQAKATAGQAEPAEPATTTTTTSTGPAGFNAGNVMKLPGMEKYATKPAPAKAPNFAQQGGGYAKVNQPTTVSYSTGTKPATAPAATAPVIGPIKIGGQTLNPSNPADKKIIDKVQAQTAKVAEALKRPVAEMLSMVETKEDVAKIKQFVDQTFVKYGAVSESAFVVRNKLIEHITQVGAQRRREFARKS